MFAGKRAVFSPAFNYALWILYQKKVKKANLSNAVEPDPGSILLKYRQSVKKYTKNRLHWGKLQINKGLDG